MPDFFDSLIGGVEPEKRPPTQVRTPPKAPSNFFDDIIGSTPFQFSSLSDLPYEERFRIQHGAKGLTHEQRRSLLFGPEPKPESLIDAFLTNPFQLATPEEAASAAEARRVIAEQQAKPYAPLRERVGRQPIDPLIGRLIPFPGLAQALIAPETLSPAEKNLGFVAQPLPKAVQEAFVGFVEGVRKFSPNTAKLIEDTMAASPAFAPGMFTGLRQIRNLPHYNRIFPRFGETMSEAERAARATDVTPRPIAEIEPPVMGPPRPPSEGPPPRGAAPIPAVPPSDSLRVLNSIKTIIDNKMLSDPQVVEGMRVLAKGHADPVVRNAAEMALKQVPVTGITVAPPKPPEGAPPTPMEPLGAKPTLKPIISKRGRLPEEEVTFSTYLNREIKRFGKINPGVYESEVKERLHPKVYALYFSTKDKTQRLTDFIEGIGPVEQGGVGFIPRQEFDDFIEIMEHPKGRRAMGSQAGGRGRKAVDPAVADVLTRADNSGNLSELLDMHTNPGEWVGAKKNDRAALIAAASKRIESLVAEQAATKATPEGAPPRPPTGIPGSLAGKTVTIGGEKINIGEMFSGAPIEHGKVVSVERSTKNFYKVKYEDGFIQTTKTPPRPPDAVKELRKKSVSVVESRETQELARSQVEDIPLARAQAVINHWHSKMGTYVTTPQGIEPTEKRLGGTYKEINERNAANKVQQAEAIAKRIEVGTATANDLAMIEKMHKNLPKEARVSKKPSPVEPPRFEPTQAGMQGVIPGTPPRKIADAGALKPPIAQREDPLPLERAATADTQIKLETISSDLPGTGPAPLFMKQFFADQIPKPTTARYGLSKLSDGQLEEMLQLAEATNRPHHIKLINKEIGRRLAGDPPPPVPPKYIGGGIDLADGVEATRSIDLNQLPPQWRDAILSQVPVPQEYAAPGKVAAAKLGVAHLFSFFNMPYNFVFRGVPGGEFILKEWDGVVDRIRATDNYLRGDADQILSRVRSPESRIRVRNLLDTEGARYVAEEMNILNPTGTPIPEPPPESLETLRAAFRALSDDERFLYAQLRQWIDGAGRSVGYEPGRAYTDYLSRFRERLSEKRTLEIQVGGGRVPHTLQQVIPPRIRPYFERPRTTDQPADLPLEQTLHIFSHAIARRIAVSGGIDPRSGTPVEGFLHRVNPALETIPTNLTDFTRTMLENNLGLGRGAIDEYVVADFLKTIEFSRDIALNPLSAVKNYLQKINTFAEVGPVAFVQGYMDMYDPQRLAIAKAAGADFDMGAILQEVGTVEGLGKLRKLTNDIQRVNAVLAKLFTMTEEGNQVHAFLAALRRGEQTMEIGPELIDYARTVQSEAQMGRPSSQIGTWQGGSLSRIIGMYKRFATGQFLYPFRMLSKDIAGMQSNPQTWIPRRFMYWALATAALIGADGFYPGLDDKVRENIWEKWPGGAAGLLGMALSDSLGLIDDPKSIGRIVGFWLPGPIFNRFSDGLTGAAGRDWLGNPLMPAQQVERLSRALPGIPFNRLRKSFVEARAKLAGDQMLTPETWAEAMGLKPPTGPAAEPRTWGEVLLHAVGPRSTAQMEESRQRWDIGAMRAEYERTIRRASDLFAGGQIAADRGDFKTALAMQNDAHDMIVEFNEKYPGANAKLSSDSLRAARQRRTRTPSEIQRKALPRSLRQTEPILGPPPPPVP